MWLFENHRTHIWISDVDNIFRWRNYIEKISIFDQKMGRWWRCGPKALGKWGIWFTVYPSLTFHSSFQSKFSAFKNKYWDTFNSDNFDYDSLAKSDYVFMRWKEHFLVSRSLQNKKYVYRSPKQQYNIINLLTAQVPDHTIKDINGASFAGFYYICFQKSKAEMEGYYYHRSSEW